MRRLLALLVLMFTLGLGVTPALAIDPTAGVNAGTSPGDWFDKQKAANPNWEVTNKISPAMAQILSQALIDFGGYKPGNVCQASAASQAWQALADAANSGPLEGFLDAIKGALGGIKDVATFGADPTAAADLMSPGALTQKAFDTAKEMGQDAGKDYLKKRLKEIWTGKPVEVLSRTETRGSCETMLVATWDEAAGTYEIVIYGDCHCAAVGGWELGSAGTSLKTFAVTLTGTVTPAVSQGRGVYIVGLAKARVVANCTCGSRTSSTAGGGSSGGGVIPGPTGGGTSTPPPLPKGDGWSKVTTKCPKCQPIVDQIHAAQAARNDMDEAFGVATAAVNEAKAKLDGAAPAQQPAAKAALDAATAHMADLTAREAGLIKLEEELWARLQACEAGCEHASSGNCPVRDGEYALGAAPKDAMGAAVLAQLNAARADPHAYADSLRKYEGYYHGNLVSEPGHPVAMTVEGSAAVVSAISYLDQHAAVAPLTWNASLAIAANRLVMDAGPRGGLGHTGSDGSTMTTRIRDVCIWAGAMDEDISLVPRTAEGVVRQLVIDDGVPTRGHRTAIFDPGLSIAGVACGPHATYGWMCVIDFAGGLMPAPGSEVPAAMAPPPPPP
jgi:uncharacterized protein YkwD